jgi:oligoendopeptidase F
MSEQIRTRAEIPVEDTWDLESIFADEKAVEAAFKKAEAMFPKLSEFQGTLGDGVEQLLDFLKYSEDVDLAVMHIYVYAALTYSHDTTDTEAGMLAGRAQGLATRAGAAAAFAEPEMMAIGFDTLNSWMDQNDALAEYRHYFDRLQKGAPHVRSAEVEELLSSLQDPFSSATETHGILVNADMEIRPAVDSEGKEHEVAHANVVALMASTDRELRRTAWQNYADAHLRFKHTQANIISTGVKNNVFMARARKYDNALDAALLSTHIPPAVYHNLIDTFQKHLPTWHKSWAVRKKGLKLDEFHIYDSRAALTENMPVLDFNTCFDWIVEGLKPLGDEYINVMKKGVLEERWVDRYPNKGKRYGAFSWGYRGTRPFILMNHNEDIFGLSTLAHELGHSMHSYFTKKNQAPTYHNYGLFAAEVASNFNQALVRNHLLETQPDRDLQIAIIEEAMANFRRYFNIMPTLSRFELEIHQQVERGEALSGDGMLELMADLFTETWGPDVAVDREREGSTWMQFSTHLYSNFYVFRYATGIAGAHALAEKIAAGDEQARDAYLHFLTMGGHGYPLDLLRDAGVDLSQPAAVETTFKTLASYVDQLEKLVG